MTEPSSAPARRAIWLAYCGRFADELLSGPLTVLTPTFRRVFDLSLVQVGLLMQVLEWVALAVEPVAASLIDLRSRRALLAFGATTIGLASVVMGLAPTYAALLAGFALYGLGSGPLAHTADVVVVELGEAHPDRAYTRATMLDTVGALLSPAALAAAVALGVSWRVVLVGFGAAGVAYGAALGLTAFPPPRAVEATGRLVGQLVGNVGQVLGDPAARRWLAVLFAFDVVEAPAVLEYVWLAEEVGLGQGWVAVYAAGEMVVGLVALAWLDRWLAEHDARRALVAAAVALAVLTPAWVLAPGVWGRVAVGVPLAFAGALVWPIAKARSLASVPGRAGAIQAVTTVFPLVPLALLFARLADWVGIGPAIVGFATPGALALAVLAARTSRGGGI